MHDDPSVGGKLHDPFRPKHLPRYLREGKLQPGFHPIFSKWRRLLFVITVHRRLD